MGEDEVLCKSATRARLALIAAVVCTLLLHAAAAAQEKPVVYWPYFEFEPLFIVDDEGVSGVGPAILEWILPRIEGYEHQPIYAPPQRGFLMARQNTTICLAGPLKRPEREAFLVYSEAPIILTPPLVVVARKGGLDGLVHGGEVSLEALLGRADLKIGLSKGFSYGPLIDGLISGHVVQSSVVTVYSPEYARQSLLMLAAGFIDYTVMSAHQVKLYEQPLGLAGKLRICRLAEDAGIMEGFIACTRNEHGREVIRQANQALKDFVPSRSHLELLLDHLPGPLCKDFVREYRRVYGWGDGEASD